MVTQRRAFALTQSPNHWNPLKGLSKECPVDFPKGGFSLYSLSGASNSSKNRSSGARSSHDISSKHTAEEIKRTILLG